MFPFPPFSRQNNFTTTQPSLSSKTKYTFSVPSRAIPEKSPRRSPIKMGDGTVAEEAPFPLTDIDKWVLSLTDEEFEYHDWADLSKVIGW